MCGWHCFCSTDDTGSLVPVELLSKFNCCTENYNCLLHASSAFFFILCSFFITTFLKTRDCTFEYSFSPHVPSSAGAQTLVALTKAFLWWTPWLEQIYLIQNSQETSANNLFMQSCTCCCSYGQRKQCLVLSREPSREDTIVTHSVLTAALQGEQVTAQGLSSVSFPPLLPRDLPQ